MIINEMGTSNEEVYVSELIKEKKNIAKNEYKKFEESLERMKNIQSAIANNKGFRGKAVEGYSEMFDILVQFHTDLVKETPDIYKAIENYFEELEQLKQAGEYTVLG